MRCDRDRYTTGLERWNYFFENRCFTSRSRSLSSCAHSRISSSRAAYGDERHTDTVVIVVPNYPKFLFQNRNFDLWYTI